MPIVTIPAASVRGIEPRAYPTAAPFTELDLEMTEDQMFKTLQAMHDSLGARRFEHLTQKVVEDKLVIAEAFLLVGRVGA